MTEQNDIPLDCLVTERRIVTCDGEEKNIFGDTL